jgi:hypothetical protein
MKKLSSITNRSTTARALDIECHYGEKEMNISITLTPRVNIPNRADGNKFGIGDVVDLRCVATPVGSNIAAIGGVGYRIKQGSGKLTEVAVLPGGTAVFTASGKAEVELGLSTVTLSTASTPFIPASRGSRGRVASLNGKYRGSIN